jgi:hypothetical protein
MKILILILGCLLLVIPCQATEEQFEEIERYISRLRCNTENYYSAQLSELKQRAQSKIRLLEAADKAVYASLAAQAEVAKTVLHINNYGYRASSYLEAKTERMLQLEGGHESYGDFPEDNIRKSPKRFAVAQSRIAERKSRILAKLEREAVNLERQKNYFLTVALTELEKRLKEDVQKPKPKPTHGLLTGVLYSADKPSAIVDRKIVHEGDTIHGVTVVKIHKDKAGFEKNGRKWEQKVQQMPEAYWK